MGFYLLYRQGSFFLREYFSAECDAANRAALLPESAYMTEIIDLANAPPIALDWVEKAFDMELLRAKSSSIPEAVAASSGALTA